MSSSLAAQSFDALVIGAGPAGASAAGLLARAGWRVALVEKRGFPRDKVCGGFVGGANAPLLQALGIAAEFDAAAGPQIREVGLFAGEHAALAPMPGASFGRALSRSALDSMLLEAARRNGCALFQPCSIEQIETDAEGFRCRAQGDTQAVELRARHVIAAHGFWEPGTLVTQPARSLPAPGDLLGFKAAFAGGALRAGLMPLLAFPGGYGGLVNAGGDTLTLSFCVRRDRLAQCRAHHPGSAAGEAVLAHMLEHCAPLRAALRGAERRGAWLAAGPVRPGARGVARAGIFAIGNAAGEAHPAIAEGIGMAMQSAALLCALLLRGDAPQKLAATYQHRWSAEFSSRIAASRAFAAIAMRPGAAALSARLLAQAPALLAACARLSGKARAPDSKHLAAGPAR